MEPLCLAVANKQCLPLQAEGRLTQFGKLCATPFGVDVVGITELVALTGALVGGERLLPCLHAHDCLMTGLGCCPDGPCFDRQRSKVLMADVGVTARQRKRELEVLNEQLRKINLNLRQQARASTIYTPGLNFAPRDQPSSSDSTPSSHSNGHSVSLHSMTLRNLCPGSYHAPDRLRAAQWCSGVCLVVP